MIRPAARPLTGPETTWRGEPVLKLGRRPEEDKRWDAKRQGWHGQPAVTVDLRAERSGARTFESVTELAKLSNEIMQAAEWLAEQQQKEAA